MLIKFINQLKLYYIHDYIIMVLAYINRNQREEI